MQSNRSIAVPTKFEDSTESVIEASLALESDLQAQFARDFFRNLLGIELSHEESLRAWQTIAERRAQLTREKGKAVSFRQALLEYLVTSARLRAPVITEFDELRRLRLNSTNDPSTGAGNRRLFDAFLGKEVQLAARYGYELSLVLIDLNSLKQVNEARGHAVGDELLKLGVSLIIETLRSSDYIYRIGGDEFALLLPRTAHPEACALAERVRHGFEEAVKPRNLGIAVRLAYGVATSPREAEEPKVLMELASRRLCDFKKGIGSPPHAPRSYERLPLLGVDAYALIKGNTHPERGRLVDFSLGGVGMRIPQQLQVPESFDAELCLQIFPPVPVSLRKVYLGPQETEGRRLGCAFAGALPDYVNLRRKQA